uniref:G-protein coupled receptors family 1 profile domain-containing protein n=1 Tax=Equus asinus asinus TaxID=83772 RepID=A0A8C4LR00_EQUAS
MYYVDNPVLNQSGPTEFVFCAFTAVPEFQALFSLHHLGDVQTRLPSIYFFLSNLWFLEICYTSVVVPLMLSNIFGTQKPILLAGWGAQMFFFVTLGSTDCFLLAVMTYELYMAICYPLHYTLVMTQKLCIQMVASALGLALFLYLQLTSLIFTLPFCGHHQEINHFLCVVPPVLWLAYTDIHVHQAILYAVGILVLTVSFLLTCVSYVFIICAILHIRSAEGHCQAFSTSSSHLTVVLLAQSGTSDDEDCQVALVYTFVTPILNPLIYTLGKKDIKGALRNAVLVKRCLVPVEGLGGLVWVPVTCHDNKL